MAAKVQADAVDAALKALATKVAMMTNSIRKIPANKVGTEGAQGIGAWKGQLEQTRNALESAIETLDRRLVEESVHADNDEPNPVTTNAAKRRAKANTNYSGTGTTRTPPPFNLKGNR